MSPANGCNDHVPESCVYDDVDCTVGSRIECEERMLYLKHVMSDHVTRSLTARPHRTQFEPRRLTVFDKHDDDNYESKRTSYCCSAGCADAASPPAYDEESASLLSDEWATT